MTSIKMECNAYYKDKGFKIGRKYLHTTFAKNGELSYFVELTPEIISELKKIKEKYGSNDPTRTQQVIELVHKNLLSRRFTYFPNGKLNSKLSTVLLVLADK